jgi:uncharacterized membrane protein
MSLVVLLKLVHVTALCLWCGGLVILPTLFRKRTHLRDKEELYELQRFARAIYIVIASPAAFIAVFSGTALVFAREAFTIWMFLKLAAVGALVGLHVRIGFVLIHLFEPGRSYAFWRQIAGTGLAAGIISSILALVLGKPDLDLHLPNWLTTPGGLQSLFETMRPMP